MKKRYKLPLFVFSLAGLGLSLGILSLFYPIRFITDAVAGYCAAFPWLNTVFIGFGAFLCLCFLLLLLAALLSPDKSNLLTFVKSGGSLQFSRQTVESTVRLSFADVEGINLSRVRAKIGKQPEQTKIYVTLSLNDSSRLIELTEAIQGKIESVLKSSLGITPKFIQIRVTDFSPDHKNQKESHGETDKNSRVE